jgi:exonuclease SbcD
MEEWLSQNTPIATILEFIQHSGQDEDTLQELLAQFQDIQHALPYEIRNGEEGFDFSNPDFIKLRLQNVEDLILYYLSETEVEAL